MSAKYPTIETRPLRKAAEVVVYQGLPYYANSVDELVKMTDCTCGVSYDFECPVNQHRDNAADELDENSGVHRFQMTDEQIAARRQLGEQLYAHTKRRDRTAQPLAAIRL